VEATNVSLGTLQDFPFCNLCMLLRCWTASAGLLRVVFRGLTVLAHRQPPPPYPRYPAHVAAPDLPHRQPRSPRPSREAHHSHSHGNKHNTAFAFRRSVGVASGGLARAAVDPVPLPSPPCAQTRGRVLGHRSARCQVRVGSWLSLRRLPFGVNLDLPVGPSRLTQVEPGARGRGEGEYRGFRRVDLQRVRSRASPLVVR
jgi:hypothetical protein